MIPYAKHFTDKRDVRAVADVVEHDWLSQGPKVRAFEEAFAARVGSKYAVAVSSGTAALHLACLAAGLKPGDRAIVPPLTFLATANAVLYCGARPDFGDVDTGTLNLDLKSARKLIGRRTKAILPVHFAGYPIDLKAERAFFKRKNITVIEDACHALGSTSGGSPVGSCRWSDMTVFSFHPLKAITTGEGGMITTNDARLQRALATLRTHGMVKDPAHFKRKPEGPWVYEMQILGYNYRLTDIQCAMGLTQLAKLDGLNAKRRKLVGVYVKEFADLAGVEIVGENAPGWFKASAHHLLTVKIDFARHRTTRVKTVESLAKKGVGTQVHYLPVHLQPYYRSIGYKPGIAPRAEKVHGSLLSLPLYPALSAADVKKVASALREVLCAR